MKEGATFYKSKNVLVTGGAGFIGSHLVEKLVELGAKVTILDNFSTGKLSNLKSVITRVNLLCADVSSEYSCMKATISQDIVFHLAAFISVPLSIKNPELCNTINIQGTKNILEACRENNVKTLIYSSSSAVYGEKNERCQEQDTPKPQTPYASSKLEGETLCQKYAQEYGISTACLRYFNVYGERQNPNGEYAAVVAKFKQNLSAQKPLIIYGDGKQTRDFTHVSKVVEANLNLGQKTYLKGDVFNIATGKSITLLDLIKQLESELNTKSPEVLFEAARPGDIMQSSACCKKYNAIVETTP